MTLCLALGIADWLPTSHGLDANVVAPRALQGAELLPLPPATQPAAAASAQRFSRQATAVQPLPQTAPPSSLSSLGNKEGPSTYTHNAQRFDSKKDSPEQRPLGAAVGATRHATTQGILPASETILQRPVFATQSIPQAEQDPIDTAAASALSLDTHSSSQQSALHTAKRLTETAGDPAAGVNIGDQDREPASSGATLPCDHRRIPTDGMEGKQSEAAKQSPPGAVRSDESGTFQALASAAAYDVAPCVIRSSPTDSGSSSTPGRHISSSQQSSVNVQDSQPGVAEALASLAYDELGDNCIGNRSHHPEESRAEAPTTVGRNYTPQHSAHLSSVAPFPSAEVVSSPAASVSSAAMSAADVATAQLPFPDGSLTSSAAHALPQTGRGGPVLASTALSSEVLMRSASASMEPVAAEPAEVAQMQGSDMLAPTGAPLAAIMQLPHVESPCQDLAVSSEVFVGAESASVLQAEGLDTTVSAGAAAEAAEQAAIRATEAPAAVTADAAAARRDSTVDGSVVEAARPGATGATQPPQPATLPLQSAASKASSSHDTPQASAVPAESGTVTPAPPLLPAAASPEAMSESASEHEPGALEASEPLHGRPNSAAAPPPSQASDIAPESDAVQAVSATASLLSTSAGIESSSLTADAGSTDALTLHASSQPLVSAAHGKSHDDSRQPESTSAHLLPKLRFAKEAEETAAPANVSASPGVPAGVMSPLARASNGQGTPTSAAMLPHEVALAEAATLERQLAYGAQLIAQAQHVNVSGSAVR